MNIVLMLLIGAPGVGKTCFARALVSCKLQNTQFIHVNYDELLPQRDYSGKENHWKNDRLQIQGQVSQFLKSVSEQNASLLFNQPYDGQKRCVVIIDDNMYYRSMRLSYYHVAQSYKCGFCQVYFETKLQDALLANSLRAGTHRVPDSVVTNIFKKIEPPVQINSWESNTVTINWDSHIPQSVFKLIEFNFHHPVPLKMRPVKEPPVANIYHDSDLALRKFVSKKVAEAKKSLPQEDFTKFTKLLMRSKAKLLSDLKMGMTVVPPHANLEMFLCEMCTQYIQS